MKSLTELQNQISALYEDFYKEMEIDTQTGIWNQSSGDKRHRFATMPHIGYRYANAPVKILFIGYDIGKDETKNIQGLKERHDSVVSGLGNLHIAGAWITALYLLREYYQNEWNSVVNREMQNNLTVVRDLPDDLNMMENIALTNRWKFVTEGREPRTGGSDRYYRNKKAELELLTREIEILDPDIIWFQGPREAYSLAETLKKQNRIVYVAYHPSYLYGCEIDGQRVDCRTPKYVTLVKPL